LRRGEAARTLLESRLLAIEGLDARRGVATVQGDTVRYVRLLSRLVEAHAGDARALLEFLGQEDLAGALRITHNLKGVAATLGAWRLAGLVEDLDTALTASLPALLRSKLAFGIQSEFSALAAALRPVVEGIDSSILSDPDPGSSSEALGELDALLDQGDFRVNQLAREYEPLLRVALGLRYDQFLHNIEQFDYEGAREILAALQPRFAT
jgi:HPt (histidine-containing phosphotransfer) domain-containing protein